MDINENIIAKLEAKNAQLKAELAQCQQRAARLRRALRGLYDVQNGPPLLKYKAEWEEAFRNAGTLLREDKA